MDIIKIEDIGSEVVYNAALKEVKKNLPFSKKIFKKDFTKEEAMKIKELEIVNTELKNLDFLRFFPDLESIIIERVERQENG